MKRRFRREQLNIKSSAGNGDMNSGRHGGKLGKKGFSLPELLIVVALMGILAVLTITGIVLFARDLKLMEMDGIARQIFVSAQNHLTRMEASGLLSEYDDAAAGLGAEGELAKAALGNAMDKAEDYPADYPVSEGKSHAESWVAEVVNNPDGHAFYRVGHRSSPALNADNNLESSILEDMLPFGAIDDTVRSGGSYYIEYDLKTAQIYAVFYTDSADGLTELEVKQLSHSGRSDDNTGMEARKSLLTTTDGGRKTVGYYGGAAAQNLETVKLLEPKIIVENGEKLQIKIQDFNYFVGDGFGNNIESRLEVTVTGVDSGKSKTFNMAIGNTPNSDGYYPYSTESNNTWLWKAVNIPAITAGGVTVPEHMQYTLTLDDISKTGTTNASGIYEGTHFADIFPEMIPGENIRIEAKLTSNNVLCGAVTAQAMNNSIFADANHIMEDIGGSPTDTGKLAVKVSAVRHLENLNNRVSNVSEKVETVDVADNISWNDYVYANKSSDGKTYVYAYKKGTDDVGKECSEDSFYPIENLKLKAFRGNRFVISDFVIDKKNIKALDGVPAVGLFSRIGWSGYGQKSIVIDGVTLQNFDVNGNGCNNAGALVGLIDSGCTDAQISGVLVMKGTDLSDKSSVTGAKNCGGIIGYSYVNGSGTGDGLKVTNCAVAGTLVGINGSSTADYAGGLIGRLDGRYANIRNSYASGMTSGGKYLTNSEDCNVRATGYAGGLIGYIYSPSEWSEGKYHSVMDSFSTCSVAGNEGGGGLVGSDMNKTTDYKRCYSAGPVVKVKSSGGFYGGFAGIIDATTLDDCSYNKNFYTFESGITAVGSGDTSNAIQGKTTKDMKVTGTCKTKVYDTTLNGKTYPYRPVNTTGIVLTDASGSPFTYTGMYYGDWEEPEPQEVDIPDEPGDKPEIPEIDNVDIILNDGYVYAYREKLADRDGWYWYILTTQDGIESDPVDCLEHTNNVKVTEWEYGFIMPSNKFNGNFSGNKGGYSDTGEKVEIKNKGTIGTYYFFKYEGTAPEDGYKVTPNFKFSGEKGYTVVFNTKFGCSMTLVEAGKKGEDSIAEGKKILGTKGKPMHIRCEKQLNNIGIDGIFSSKYFVQDCGFTVSGSLPVNTVTAFSGTYDATFEKNKNKRYNIEHTGTGYSTKLFTDVTGIVKAQINDNTVNQP
ncbi:MAG: type II secretion system GspH family protein [Firmicutes bacterium]|nr:type II secretion system GspH family protein [Bacillota bacterium]